MYHLVCPAKYRRVVFDDHVHFLIQSVPTYSPTKIAITVKSITAREIFKQVPEVKKKLWGGEFWSKGYFMNTVGQHGNEQSIANYVKNQGNEHDYKVLHKYKNHNQLTLF